MSVLPSKGDSLRILMRLPRGVRWSNVAVHLGAIAVGILIGAVGFGPMTKDGWPAWVQAVGSVVAIFIAVIVPNRIAAKERKTQETQWKFRAKTYAFVLLPLVKSMASGLVTARARWAQVPQRYDDDDVTEFLGIPGGLSERLLDLHEIGGAGMAIQDLVIAATQLREGVNYQYIYWRYAGTYFDPSTGADEEMPEPDDVNALFEAARERAEVAVAALTSVLNS